jgi:peptide/nickel transport system substrate-binding protein
VRKAIQTGVDQPGFIQTLFRGFGVEEGGPVASKPASPYSDPVTATPLYSFNPAASKTLLENHG